VIKAMSDGAVTIAYFYRTRWGAHDAFVELFDRNHWPILREQLASGRFLSVEASKPRFHGDGRADWDFMVTITYRDWAAIESHSEGEIAARLFPDEARYREEERRRFELLDAHWDVVLERHSLPAPE
jgi:EthD domain